MVTPSNGKLLNTLKYLPSIGKKMKFKLNKKKIKNLSKDYNKLPLVITAKIAGGVPQQFGLVTDPLETKC